MPFALVTVGLLLVIVGFQDTYEEFGAQVSKDFTGPGNFIYWLASIAIIGGIGYYKPFEGFSRAFMALIIVVMALSNKGLFENLTQALASGSAQTPDEIGAALPESGGANNSDGGFDIGKAAQIAGTVASFI